MRNTLTSCDMPCIKAMTLETDSFFINDVVSCLSAVTDRKYPHLRALDIKCYPTRGSWDATATTRRKMLPIAPATLFQCIQPLLGLHRLHDVSIDFSGFLLSPPSELRPLAEAWPALERLSLSFKSAECYPDFGATLLALAENCPCLKSLRLPVMSYDEWAIKRATSHCAMRPTAHLLRELYVQQVLNIPKGRPFMYSPEMLVGMLFPEAKFEMYAQ